MSAGQQRALVTGAANGLGRALVAQLIAENSQVVCIDIDSSALESLKSEFGDRVITKQADLSNESALQNLLDDLFGEPAFDKVFLNAGISATGNFETIPLEAHKKLLFLNATSPMLLATGLQQAGLMAKGSNLIFISSLSYSAGYPGAASYAGSKDAIAIYAKSIRKAFAKKGVAVSCVFPGPIKTDHAERHAPAGAKADSRMEPDVLAAKILKAAKSGPSSIYPGMVAKLTRALSVLAPATTTKMMRRIIFEKLDKDVW